MVFKYTRKVDGFGRIVVPQAYRDALGLSIGEEAKIFLVNDQIILERAIPVCIFCGTTEKLTDYIGRKLCDECKAAIAER